LATLEPVNVFRRISRAISRFSHSATPVPSGGATATVVDLGQIQDVQQQELPPEEQQDQESE
jgi:hypothetical protein